MARASLWQRVGKPLGRFLAWWFGMFALLGPLSNCPICGQPGCGACVEACPVGAISIQDGQARIDADKCVGCGVCEGACPAKAISLEI